MTGNIKKSDYTGWQDVFRFSFIQGVKSKAYYMAIIILSAIILIGLPVSAWINNRNSEEVGDTEIENLYVYDETGLNIDYIRCFSDSRYEKLAVKSGTGNYDDMITKLENAESSNDVAVRITFEAESYFRLMFVRAAKTDFSTDDYNAMTSDFRLFFDEEKMNAVEVDAEQAAFLDRIISTSVEYTQISEDGEVEITPEKQGVGITLSDYMAFLALIVVVMMIINLAGGSIANSIVTEKTTRVVEYLMINVRPMALIVGKILACVLQVIIQLVCFVLAYIIGSKVSDMLFGTLQVGDDSTNMWLSLLAMLGDIKPAALSVVILIIALGVLFFSIIAGLAGASVSKLEELAEGLKIYQMMIIGGSYVGIGVCIAELSGKVSGTVVNVLCMIPVSAPFVLPGNLITGKVSVWIGLASAAVLFASTAVLFKFTSLVYESMIFYNGNVLKFKDILRIAKNRKSDIKEGRLS